MISGRSPNYVRTGVTRVSVFYPCWIVRVGFLISGYTVTSFKCVLMEFLAALRRPRLMNCRDVGFSFLIVLEITCMLNVSVPLILILSIK